MKRENRRPTRPTPRHSRVANECIDAVLRGDLSGAREIARNNAGRCDGLAGELRSLRKSLDELRQLPESPDLTDRILNHVEHNARRSKRVAWRMPIIGRFAVAAGLIIVTVVSGVFKNSEEQIQSNFAGPQAALVTVEIEDSVALSLSAGDLERYDRRADPESLVVGGSGGALALSPVESTGSTSAYRGPLLPTQAVLNVRSKTRTPASSGTK